MDTFEELRRQLKDVLVHLKDPDYRPGVQICEVLGVDPAAGSGALQTRLIRFIEQVREQLATAEGSRARRNFDVLYYRFILGMTQEDTADILYLSLRSVQRAQQEGIHALACLLWQGQSRETITDAQDHNWIVQVRQELLALQRSSPDAECDLRQVIQDAWRLAETIAARYKIAIGANNIQPGLKVNFHCSALRQVFLTIVTGVAQVTLPGGCIRVAVEQRGGDPILLVQAAPTMLEKKIEISLARELVTAQGGSVELLRQKDTLMLRVQLPAESLRNPLIVLAVDDNTDQVTLYQSYCTGTRYEIIHVKEGRSVIEVAKAVRPAAILLDVILPDVDGWDLLMELKVDPATRAIPIIVCSVVTDEQLALELGAVRYLRKPIWRHQLLEALEEALKQCALESHRVL